MALLTNPMTADLQQRIQNTSFGSPDYLQGFQGTMPTWQRNMIMNNYMPGLLTPEGTNAPVDQAGIPDYRGYTPGVPPQFGGYPVGPMPVSFSDVAEMVRGGGGERTPGSPNYSGPGVSTEFVGDNAFRINSDGTVEKLDPDSIDYKLANFMNTITGFSPMSLAKQGLGLDPDADYKETLDIMQRVQNRYGQDVAKDFRDKAFSGRPTTGAEGTGSGQVGSTGPTARTGNTPTGSIRDSGMVRTSPNQGPAGGGGGGRGRGSGPTASGEKSGQASGSGRTGSTGPTGRSRGGW